MKGKLLKTEKGHYVLIDDTKGTYDNGFLIGASRRDTDANKLSIKNCEAIERGYDLNELSKEFSWLLSKDNVNISRASYHAGFQKALSILGDKLFSEDDVLKVVTHVLNELVLVDGFDKQYLFPESIYQETTTKCKSLQQTKWDVEIVMEPYHDGEFIDDGKTHVVEPKWRPELDADGCLILKRI